VAERKRPLNLSVLDDFAKPSIKAKVGEPSKRIAITKDLIARRKMLAKHFAGLTILPISHGYGLRGGELELNRHAPRGCMRISNDSLGAVISKTAKGTRGGFEAGNDSRRTPRSLAALMWRFDDRR
jgi:hypothetical protein